MTEISRPLSWMQDVRNVQKSTPITAEHYTVSSIIFFSSSCMPYMALGNINYIVQ
jgi:hypothetical protein